MEDSLAPPESTTTSHARASSASTLRPAITIDTLGRRRSGSLLQCLAQVAAEHTPTEDAKSDQHPSPTQPSDDAPQTTFATLSSRLFSWFRLPSRHKPDWSSPSSPRSSRSSRSSEDEYILPMSASAVKTSFSEDELRAHEASESFLWHLGIPSMHSPILIVMLLFPLSSILVVVAVSTLPITLVWPRTLQDLAQLGRDLHAYSQSGPGELAHVLGVLSATAVWKHAWSIPGSVIWNVLAGALFSPLLATILLTLLTTLGSLCSTVLATPLAPILTYLFPRALDFVRNALGDQSALLDEKRPNVIAPALTRADSATDISYPPVPPVSVTPPSRTASPANEVFEEKQLEAAQVENTTPTWIRLAILRLIGIVPWSGINIACGVCGVSLWDCMLGNLVGTLPWTAVTCQVGDILQTFATNPREEGMTISSLLASREIIVKLILLSVLSLAPILGRDRLKAWASGETTQGVTESTSNTASLVPSVMSTPMLAYAIPSFVSNGIPSFAQPDQGRQPGEREWQWRRWFRTLKPVQRARDWISQDDVRGWRRTLRDRLGQQPTQRQVDAQELRTLVDEKRRIEGWD